jgi:hypothetical protein
MKSRASDTFDHAIQDATDLLEHFDSLNKIPQSPNIEVFKRASLVMALAALETYFEDRIMEEVDLIRSKHEAGNPLAAFMQRSLEIDLKGFHSPNSDKVIHLFRKYLGLDISEGWKWNNFDTARVRVELNNIVKKRGDIAHRSLRPTSGEAQPSQHAVTRDDLRSHLHFIKELVKATDAYLDGKD